MAKKKKHEVHMIDMSGRFQVKVVTADKKEIDKNTKYFNELNEIIKTKTEMNNAKISAYIKELLSQTSESTNIEISHFKNCYHSMNTDHIQEVYEYYESYLSDLKRSIDNNKEQEN